MLTKTKPLNWHAQWSCAMANLWVHSSEIFVKNNVQIFTKSHKKFALSFQTHKNPVFIKWDSKKTLSIKCLKGCSEPRNEKWRKHGISASSARRPGACGSSTLKAKRCFLQSGFSWGLGWRPSQISPRHRAQARSRTGPGMWLQDRTSDVHAPDARSPPPVTDRPHPCSAPLSSPGPTILAALNLPSHLSSRGHSEHSQPHSSFQPQDQEHIEGKYKLFFPPHLPLEASCCYCHCCFWPAVSLSLWGSASGRASGLRMKARGGTAVSLNCRPQFYRRNCPREDGHLPWQQGAANLTFWVCSFHGSFCSRRGMLPGSRVRASCRVTLCTGLLPRKLEADPAGPPFRCHGNQLALRPRRRGAAWSAHVTTAAANSSNKKSKAYKGNRNEVRSHAPTSRSNTRSRTQPLSGWCNVTFPFTPEDKPDSAANSVPTLNEQTFQGSRRF